jgi:acetoacetyl-CoA synthetase
VLFAVDSYRYGGRTFDRAAALAEIRAGLPTLQHTIIVPVLGGPIDAERFPQAVDWHALRSTQPLSPEPVAADHPLWIVYSSGTTGLPKAIAVKIPATTASPHAVAMTIQPEFSPFDFFRRTLATTLV